MSVKRASLICGLLGVWAGTCAAALPDGHGIIRFEGNIVEAGCATNTGAQMDLKTCPPAGRSTRFDVSRVGPTSSVTTADGQAVNVKLVANSVSGRYYDQRYELVDNAGTPIKSGAYVVTMTSP